MTNTAIGRNNRLVEDYRDVITGAILNNPAIIEILCDGTDKTADTLLWTHVMPLRFVSQTITEAGAHVFYDIDEAVLYDERNSVSTAGVYETLTLSFWVLAHKGALIYKNRLKTDVLSYEIKNTFHGNKKLGIAPARLVTDNSFVPDNREYAARLITFAVTDFGTRIRARAESKNSE